MWPNVGVNAAKLLKTHGICLKLGGPVPAK